MKNGVAFSVERIRRLLNEISPLQRMINSKGLDQSFEILSQNFPQMQIHEYPSGMKFEDWEVPKQWELLYGEMKDRAGNVIASTDDSPLFVAAYSEEVEGWFSKEEISKHLRTRPDQPEAFALEHRNAYNYKLRTWGVSLPHSRWEGLDQDEYFISIKVKFDDGSMKAGEWVVEGTSRETICFNAHIDELCNDDLAGCLVALEIMAYIASLPKTKYSYSLLLTPELFGTLAWLNDNWDKAQEYIGVINVEMPGAGEKLLLKRSLKSEIEMPLIERVLELAFEDIGVAYDTADMFGGYGNDEKIFEWPTLQVPGVAIMRYPFKEYHTSLDVPELISDEYMQEALSICIRTVEILENDWVPVFTGKLQPWLSKHDLYVDANFDPENYLKYNQAMYMVDGKNAVSEIALACGIGFSRLSKYFEKLKLKLFVKEI